MTSKLNLLIEHLPSAITYKDYKDLVKNLLDQGKSTGHTQSEAYLNYSKLGFSRMKRWEKTFKLNKAQIDRIKAVDKTQTWLVIAEGWCGDAAPALPIMKTMSEHNQHINFKIILRDDFPDLIDAFLTNGGRSIPKLISFNPDTKQVFFTWGPRPSEATKMVEKEKAQKGELSAEFKTELQHWYNQDKGQTTVEDLISALESV